MLQTTHAIESSRILNKAVLKWQAQITTYKNKTRFITDFNKYHKNYLSMFKHTTTPIAHNVQKTNDKIGELHSLVIEQNNVINQIGERVDSVRDEASVLTSWTIPTTVTTQHSTLFNKRIKPSELPLQSVRPESPKTTTLTLPDEETVVEEEAVEEAVAKEAEVADGHQASLVHVPTKTND